MRGGEIRQYCKLLDEGQSLMRSAMKQLNLSARGYHRILKLARTIADLAGCEEIQSCIWQKRCSIAPVDVELAIDRGFRLFISGYNQPIS
jgi:magnesium chelatase family protein